jgi:hypothetical protein
MKGRVGGHQGHHLLEIVSTDGFLERPASSSDLRFARLVMTLYEPAVERPPKQMM